MAPYSMTGLLSCAHDRVFVMWSRKLPRHEGGQPLHPICNKTPLNVNPRESASVTSSARGRWKHATRSGSVVNASGRTLIATSRLSFVSRSIDLGHAARPERCRQLIDFPAVSRAERSFAGIREIEQNEVASRFLLGDNNRGAVGRPGEAPHAHGRWKFG